MVKNLFTLFLLFSSFPAKDIHIKADHTFEDKVEQVTEQDSVRLYTEKTKASYYHSKFNGRKTANGEVFSNRKLTAAHNSLPFGTVVRVTNLKTNKSVIVVINDRGKLGKNVSIDLTKEAFKSLTNTGLEKGVINVKIEIIEDVVQRL